MWDIQSPVLPPTRLVFLYVDRLHLLNTSPIDEPWVVSEFSHYSLWPLFQYSVR